MKSLSLKTVGLLLCLLMANFCLLAQNYEPDSLTLYARAEYNDSSVMVRWVPKNFETWQWGLVHGYRLERITVEAAGVEQTVGSIAGSKIILDSMLLPLPETAWESLSDSSDMAGVAAGMIYGDSMEVITYDEAGFMDVMNQNNERDIGMALPFLLPIIPLRWQKLWVLGLKIAVRMQTKNMSIWFR